MKDNKWHIDPFASPYGMQQILILLTHIKGVATMFQVVTHKKIQEPVFSCQTTMRKNTFNPGSLFTTECGGHFIIVNGADGVR